VTPLQAQMLRALDLLERHARTNALSYPSELATLVALLAPTRQEATNLPLLDASGDGARVPLLLDYDGAAAQLHVSRRTVERLVATGQLRAIRVANSPRIAREDLVSFVEGLREAS
jgi:excisionase family DNA binding protein